MALHFIIARLSTIILAVPFIVELNNWVLCSDDRYTVLYPGQSIPSATLSGPGVHSQTCGHGSNGYYTVCAIWGGKD